MDLATIGLITGIAVSAGTVIGLLVKLVTWLQSKSEARISEILEAHLADEREEWARMAHGLQSLMRANLVQMHDRYTTLGWMPDVDKQTFVELYEDYEALGANGLITAYYEDILRLPTTWEAQKGAKQ